MKVIFTPLIILSGIITNAAGFPGDSLPPIQKPGYSCSQWERVTDTSARYVFQSKVNDPFLKPDFVLVVDGVAQNYSFLEKLDPKTIKSVEIVKDTALAALYGCIYSNGAIIITTGTKTNIPFLDSRKDRHGAEFIIQ